jgi:hypothetical protein
VQEEIGIFWTAKESSFPIWENCEVSCLLRWREAKKAEEFRFGTPRACFALPLEG